MRKDFVLVTGAAGFIGSRLTEMLLLKNRNVIAIDCFLPNLYPAEIKRERWGRLKKIDSGHLELIEFDLRVDDFSIFADFNIKSIFNEAAMPGLVNNWGNYAPYYDCNLSALNRFLEFCKKLPLESFVHASTSSVYGKKAVGVEAQDLNPTSPYGVSKLAAEKLLLAYNDWFGIPVKILRYFSVYGPYQRPDMAYAKIIENLKLDTEFTMYGDGTQRRSNTYIDDIVEATILAESLAEIRDVMNVCGDETLSLNEAIGIIEECIGKKLRLNKIEGRRGDQQETSGSNKLVKSRLGWKANTAIRDGLAAQVQAATSH